MEQIECADYKEINYENLEELGFKCDNKSLPFRKYYKAGINRSWRVMIEDGYISHFSNVVSFKIYCWRCDERGSIVQRADFSYTKKFEDIYTVCSLCGIDVNSNETE